jgi:hypothetical protein
MKRITYADVSFLTDDRVADALMDYARTLAAVDSADVVRLPGIDETGALRTYELVVGPASQMITRDADDAPVPMAVEETLADLGKRRARRFPPGEDLALAGLPEGDPESTELDSSSGT